VVMETSAEAWATFAGLLERGLLVVIWHEGRACTNENISVSFD
jgi:hypothetical protein